MGRIVRDRYPIDKLPEDLRAGLSLGGIVRVTIEEVSRMGEGDDAAPAAEPRAKPTLEQLFARRRPYFATSEEVDAYVRAMRDEWD